MAFRWVGFTENGFGPKSVKKILGLFRLVGLFGYFC